MYRIMFVCHGNICRSPMAELYFKDLVKLKGLELSFRISSFATCDYNDGSGIYPPAKKTLIRHAIPGEHISRHVELKDIMNNDYILVMDENNLSDILRLTGGRYFEKIYKLLSFTGETLDVADPYFTGDFERTFSDIERGCKSFLDYLLKSKPDLFNYDKYH